MKNISNFGAWIIENSLFIFVILLSIGAITIIIMAPNTVTLSEKEFKCAESSPYGLSTRCDVYIRRVK